MFYTWLSRGFLLLILLLAGWGIGSSMRGHRMDPWLPYSNKLRVLTTIFPIYDFTREVGGTEIEVRNLLPPGVDPHEFALSPRDAELVAGADLILANGIGLDDFILEAARKAGVPEERVVRVAPDSIMISRTELIPKSELSDPHRWIDPVLAGIYVRRISSALVAANYARGVAVEVNQRIRAAEIAYMARLAVLDRDYQHRLSGVPGRSMIAFHGAFENLARRYGLKLVAVWQRTPGREPAPREVGRILQVARIENVRALFSEPQFSPKAIEMIAADAHLPVYTLDPVETAPDFATTHYIDVMKHNLDTLVTALGGGPAGGGK